MGCEQSWASRWGCQELTALSGAGSHGHLENRPWSASSLEVGGDVPLGQLRGRWLLKRGSGDHGGPQASPHSSRTSATCPRRLSPLSPAPGPASLASHFIFVRYSALAGGVLCKWGGCSSWRHRRDQGQVGCRYFMSPCPGVTVSQPSLHAVAAVWSPVGRGVVLCPWSGPRAHGVVSHVRGHGLPWPVEWSPCPWCGLPCPWHGLPCPWCGHLCPWHGLPCPWCDFRVCGVVSVAKVSPGLRGMVSVSVV